MTTDEIKQYGLLGGKLSHSYSPLIHEKLGNPDCKLFEADASQAEAFILSGNYSWLNVTIPYKLLAKEKCDVLSATAQRTGNVNTIIPRDGKLFGYNTDYDGFRRLLISQGVFVNSKKALILGNGGAAKTVKAVLEDMGASNILSITRNGINNYSNLYLHADAQIIVNATPVGTYPNILESPCDLSLFPQLVFVADLTYNPFRTMLLQQAEYLGIHSCNGLLMLVNQAVSSTSLHKSISFPANTATRIAKEIIREKRNIAIVGMPGSGKTTLAKALADATGKEFLDTDEIIERTEKRTVHDILENDGEAYFRNVEEKAVKEALFGSGRIVATGGGAVISSQSRSVIRANSLVVYLDAPLSELDRTARPLSVSADALSAIYHRRLPLYTEVSDITVKRSGSIKKNIDCIMEAL